MAEIDLAFISKQLDRVLSEQAGMRDEMLVLAARFDRLEKATTVVSAEARVVLAARFIRLEDAVNRMNDRIAKLEDA